MRPEATSVCGLKVLLYAALLLCLHARYGRDNTERQGSDGFGDRYSVSYFTSTNVQILTLAVLASTNTDTGGVGDRRRLGCMVLSLLALLVQKYKYQTCRGGAVVWREYSDISCDFLFYFHIPQAILTTSPLLLCTCSFSGVSVCTFVPVNQVK